MNKQFNLLNDFTAPLSTTVSSLNSLYNTEGSTESTLQSDRTILSESFSLFEQISQPTQQFFLTEDDYIQAYFIRNQQDLTIGLPNISTPESTTQLPPEIIQTISAEAIARRRITQPWSSQEQFDLSNNNNNTFISQSISRNYFEYVKNTIRKDREKLDPHEEPLEQ